MDSHLFFAKFWILIFTILYRERLVGEGFEKSAALCHCRGVNAHACRMSKILLLFYPKFDLDQGRGQFADEKYQRSESGVVQDRFFSRTCERDRNISWFRFSTLQKHVEYFDHSIVSRVYGYWSISKKNCAMFSINSSFLCRLQLSIGTVGAQLSFRALLRHVTITLSPFQVMSLASSEESLVSVLDWSESCWLDFIWVTAFQFVVVWTRDWGP